MAESHAAEVHRHWYWRPGWGLGSRFYTWHITFGDQPEVARLSDAYRSVLSQQPLADCIPTRWLHLTMQGIGFVDQVGGDDVDAIVAATRKRCAPLDPITVTLGAPHVDPESVQIKVEPAEPVRALRFAIRSAIADVWGAERVPEAAEPFSPHMSLAYINADGPAGPLVEALSSAPRLTARAVVAACQLIVLNRDSEMYVWEPYATVPFGAGTA